MREAQLQRTLRERLKKLGFATRKVQWVGCRGAPDLLVLFGSSHEFVEVKTQGGKLTPLQRREHEILRAGGFHVHTIYGEFGVKLYLEAAQLSGRGGAAPR